MAIIAKVNSTDSPYINGLLYPIQWIGPITFSFTDSPSDYEDNYGNGETESGYNQISELAMQAMRAIILGEVKLSPSNNAVKLGMGVSNFTLLKITDAGYNVSDIRIGQSSIPSTAYAYMPSDRATGGDIWFGTRYSETFSDYRNPILGNYSYLTLAHEIGHALGLKHAHEKGGVENISVPTDRNGIEFSIMSYVSYINGPTSGYTFGQWSAPQSYMMLDIAALQQLYGANFTYRDTDNTYSRNRSTGEMSVDGVGQGQPGGNKVFETLWDGGGHDTFDASNYNNSVNVDLSPGGWSKLSSNQTAHLSQSQIARGNVFNTMLFNNDIRSLIEDARGGASNDTITGNQVDNHLWGGAGNDSLSGGAGNDTLEGGAGQNKLRGGQGDDIYIINGSDRVIEDYNEGIDSVYSYESYELASNVENLTLTGNSPIDGTGNSLNNIIIGNSGNNNLRGRLGIDTLVGGQGNDTYIVDDERQVIIESYNEGIDNLIATVSFILPNNVEKFMMTEVGGLSGTGNSLGNTMFGNKSANMLAGKAGNDTIFGRAGNDTLDGGEGDDVMDGGLGDDTFLADTVGDVVWEAADAGIDLVQASVDFTLGDNIENLTLTGVARLLGVGNALGNVLTGNDAANVLVGRSGNDTLIGGRGNDTLIGGLGIDMSSGGKGADVFRFVTAAEGGDQIMGYVVEDDAIEVSAGGFGGGLIAGMDMISTNHYAENLTGEASSANGCGQFVFETDANRLWWDTDGAGGTASTLFVTLTGTVGFNHSEIIIIA